MDVNVTESGLSVAVDPVHVTAVVIKPIIKYNQGLLDKAVVWKPVHKLEFKDDSNKIP